jgi:organic hydroperoxide reductase OsmC/OhrA
MSVMKEIQFPLSIRWRGGGIAHAHARGKDSLTLATPAEFRSGLAGHWTPEDLLVLSAASSFTLSLAAIAERDNYPLVGAEITATGHMSRRDDGRFGFTVIEVDACLETLPGHEDDVQYAASKAQRSCLITPALDVPVHVAVTVESIPGAPHSQKEEAGLATVGERRFQTGD